MLTSRFTAKKNGPNGAAVKDNLTGRVVATFPPDPDHPEMALKFANAAADEFNRLTYEKYRSKLKYGQQNYR